MEQTPMEWNRIPSHPLFSTIVALYTLILLYIPTLFLKTLLSPLFNCTGILFLSVLKLGANERMEKEYASLESRFLDSGECDRPNRDGDHMGSKQHEKWVLPETHLGSGLENGLERPENEYASPESRFLDSVDYDHIHPNGDHMESKQHEKWVLPETHLGSGLENELERPENEYASPELRFLDSSDYDHMEPKQLKNWVLPETHLESGLENGLCPKSIESTQEVEVFDCQMESPKVVEEEDQEYPVAKMGVGQGSGLNPFYEDSFREWDMRAPLEIIYEVYEGEEEEDDDESKGNDGVLDEKRVTGLERYPSLSNYYPETDTDSSSDGEYPVIRKWEMPERMFFKWEEEEMIEIALDHGKRNVEFYHVEEDNLIEIDIHLTES